MKRRPIVNQQQRNPFQGMWDFVNISKTDTFHEQAREVTVNCRKCSNKFRMSYLEYFSETKPRYCPSCI